MIAIKRLWRYYVAIWQAWCVLTWHGPRDIQVTAQLVRCPCGGRCGRTAVDAILTLRMRRAHMLIPSGRLTAPWEVHRRLDEAGAKLWQVICQENTAAVEPIAGQIKGSG